MGVRASSETRAIATSAMVAPSSTDDGLSSAGSVAVVAVVPSLTPSLADSTPVDESYVYLTYTRSLRLPVCAPLLMLSVFVPLRRTWRPSTMRSHGWMTRVFASLIVTDGTAPSTAADVRRARVPSHKLDCHVLPPTLRPWSWWSWPWWSAGPDPR